MQNPPFVIDQIQDCPRQTLVVRHGRDDTDMVMIDTAHHCAVTGFLQPCI